MFMKTLPKDNFDINQYNLHNYYDIFDVHVYINQQKIKKWNANIHDFTEWEA